MNDFTIFVLFVLGIFGIIAWALSRVAVAEAKRDAARAAAEHERIQYERDKLGMLPLRGEGGRFKSRTEPDE